MSTVDQALPHRDAGRTLRQIDDDERIPNHFGVAAERQHPLLEHKNWPEPIPEPDLHGPEVESLAPWLTQTMVYGWETSFPRRV